MFDENAFALWLELEWRWAHATSPWVKCMTRAEWANSINHNVARAYALKW
jgi:hypothetical protein